MAAFKKITLPNGIVVQAKVIKDINSYRGFYVVLPDNTYVVNSFNSQGFESHYTNGFDTGGKNVVEHLFNKLLENKKLTKHETEEFYERVNLFNPIVQYKGKYFNFSIVLKQIKGINFYTLSSKISTVGSVQDSVSASGNS
jgi:hypothetical protein